MVEYCDTPETERREQTGNTKHTYTLEASSLLDRLYWRQVPRQQALVQARGTCFSVTTPVRSTQTVSLAT